MPRVADIYSRPAGIDGIPNQTIESADYNLNVADVETDLNLPRPIVAGGTGATSAAGARDNLDAEVRGVQVTNYDSHVWEAGSFWSLGGATGAPNGNAFAGIAYIYAAGPNHIVLEARDLQDSVVPKRLYVRHHNGISWSAWAVDGAGAFVELTGDTMTGDLIINKASPVLGLKSPNSTTSASIVSSSDTPIFRQRWGISLGLGDASGDDFGIGRYHVTTGAFQDFPLRIDRATGLASVTGNPTAALGVATKQSVDLKVNKTGDSMSGALTFSTAQGITFTGGGLIYRDATGVIVHSGGGSASAFQWNNTANAANLMSLHDQGLLKINTAVATAALNGEKLMVTSSGASALAATALGVDRVIGVLSSGASSYAMMFFQGSVANFVGNIITSTVATAYNTTSDERLKEDLKSFDAGNIIDDTNVYDFAWKSTGERSYGIIAQQAKDVYPHAVHYAETEDRWFIDYSKYVPILIQELKALRARVAELEDKVGAGAQPT